MGISYAILSQYNKFSPPFYAFFNFKFLNTQTEISDTFLHLRHLWFSNMEYYSIGLLFNWVNYEQTYI